MTDIQSLVAQMTLEEKASLLGGDDFWHTKAVERLGIPRFMMSDGPHGLRKQSQESDHLGVNASIRAVCFPAACATASSFDTDLIRGMGEIIGDECLAEDLAIVLGPAVNIKRSPLCGRNFEYFSEDPYLAGKMASNFVQGVQSRHVGTSIKHFAANNQEANRMNVSVQADERTLREIYFPPFEIAVREAQPKTVMCSYNKINGTYSADNEWLLTDVLRSDWGFEGFVMTDWGAVSDRVQGVRAGLELEMPGNTAANDRKIVEAVKSGALDEEKVDEAVRHLLTVLYDYEDNRPLRETERSLAETEKPLRETESGEASARRSPVIFDMEKDHAAAVRIEKECAVLLANNGILPLKKGVKAAYIGEFAEKPRYQGGGSSHINSFKVTSALGTAQEKGRPVVYEKGFPADRDEMNGEDKMRAVAAAAKADVAVIFAGLPDIIESEGYDRDDMKLPACQNELIEAVLAVQPNTVIVLHNGSPVETPWADDVSAVLEMYLGGQGVGEATDALLYGEANPCGHLAETFPLRLQDNPSYLNFPGNGKTVDYAEGVYVGYRYYDRKEMPVRWAFGHGLSYTDFAMDHLRIDRGTLKEGETLTVCVDVTNTGALTGKEVVQLYIADKNGTAGRPVKELKGFAKVSLEPGETKTVSFTVCERDLSYFEERIKDWYAPGGSYEILVGDASDHILCAQAFEFVTDRLLPIAVGPDTTIGELMADRRTRPVVAALWDKMQAFTEDSQGEEGGETGGLGAGAAKMGEAMARYMPLKSLVSFGNADDEMVNALMEELRRVQG